PYAENGLLLFSGDNFSGKFFKLYETAIPDITPEFPSGDDGVSSAIVWKGGAWELHTEANYGGLNSVKGQGEYKTHGDLGIKNNSMKSVRPSTFKGKK
uniref:beta/gamma crystallin-related protein n=1 Tax=Salmonella sp. s54925 TaxID=3159674 RepID=UPI0039812543